MKKILTIFFALALVSCPVFSQKKDTYKVRTVVIDPGHGGAKPGAQGSRSWEKNITLDVAKKFGQLIQDNYPDVKVIYTRTTDVDISLAERAHIANRNKADLFISIHANSHPTATPTGVETFVMGLSESKANLEVARKENADILLETGYKNNADYQGFDPNSPETYVMLAMFQNSFIDKSLNLAQAIQTQYKQNLKTINRGVKQAELYVLYKTTCPSVLTEIGFISNPNEEAYMLSEEGQAKIAICLFNAFMTYKATEEGTGRIANPVIRIKGYQAPATDETKTDLAEAQPTDKAEPVPAPKPESKVEPKPEPKVEPKPEPKVEPKVEAIEPPSKTSDKPVPTVEMPRRDEQARNINEPAPKAEPAPEPKPQPEPTPKPEPSPAPTLQAPQHTATSDDQFYTVQFLTTNVILSSGDPRLGGISDFETIKKGNSYAYITGRFATKKEASDYCAHIKAATHKFKDAWPYLFKRPATQTDTQAAQNTPATQTATTTQTTTATPAPQPTQPATPSGIAVYRVQFMSATREMKAGDPDLHGISDFRCAQNGKVYVYTAGNYKTLREAQQRCAEIRKSTRFRDAFVVAFDKSGERVPLR